MPKYRVSATKDYKPSLDQALLSLTMHRNTGFSDAIQTLHKPGYGISYKETLFIEGKWAD